jgi:hypothetical protein
VFLCTNDVIPVLVTGIHRASCSRARGWLDPGHKARDDSYDVFMMKGLPPPGPLLIHTLLDCR